MFTFNFNNNNVYLTFDNDFLHIQCQPDEELLNNKMVLGSHIYYEKDENEKDNFSFSYDDEKVIFSSGQLGSIVIVLKMTKEIKNSLEKALEDWRKQLDNNN